MNLLTPERGSRLHQMDIETGRTVAEWDFQKDGVDVDMKDLINDTKGAPLPPPPPPLTVFLHCRGLLSTRLCVQNLVSEAAGLQLRSATGTRIETRQWPPRHDPTSVAGWLSCSRVGLGQCCLATHGRMLS